MVGMSRLAKTHRRRDLQCHLLPSCQVFSDQKDGLGSRETELESEAGKYRLGLSSGEPASL